MNSRTLLNLALLAVVAVLGFFAYFQPGLDDDEPQPSPLMQFKPEEVARIRIERAVAEDVAFERRDGKWWMTEPVQAPANPLRMDGVLRIGEAKSERHYPASRVEVAAVGLEPADVLLFFNDAPPIAFGDTEPLTRQRYVRVGDTVHLLEDTAYYHVIGGYTTFLDSALLPEGAVIEGLTLPGLKLSRVQDRWRVDPTPAGFSADQVNQLLDEWRHAQAIEVQRYEGGKGRGEAVIQLKGNAEPLRFAIVHRDHGSLVLARKDLGLQYQMPEEAAQRLLTFPAPPPNP